MPCMCGDPYCWSCGPAQGNYRCPVCNKWTMDGGCEDEEKCNAILEEEARQEREFESRVS